MFVIYLLNILVIQAKLEILINILKNIKLNFYPISREELINNRINNPAFTYAKMQEATIINVLNNLFPVDSCLLAISINEYIEVFKSRKYKDIKMSTKYDLFYGDIIVIDLSTHHIISCIDLKVADNCDNKFYKKLNRYFLGCISKNSFETFGSNYIDTDNRFNYESLSKHLYFCTSFNGKEHEIIDANKLYNKIYNDPKSVFYTSKDGKKYIPSKYILDNLKDVCYE